MEQNVSNPSPELLTAKLLEADELMEEEEFRHLNNWVSQIMRSNWGINSTLLMVMPVLKLL
jgi:hypothetical protein